VFIPVQTPVGLALVEPDSNHKIDKGAVPPPILANILPSHESGQEGSWKPKTLTPILLGGLIITPNSVQDS